LDRNYTLPGFSKWMVPSAVVWVLQLGVVFFLFFHVVMKVPLNVLVAPFVSVSVVGNAGMVLIYGVKRFVRGPRRRALGVTLTGGGVAISTMLVLASTGLRGGILDPVHGRLIYGTILATALLCVIFSFLISKWLQDLYQGEPHAPQK
jgi:Kef-type K+ transport system membrane component KefB